MRTLSLVDSTPKGNAALETWLWQHDDRVERLPCDEKAGVATLHALEVTDRCWLGAIARHTGGLLVHGGWLRVLGAGHPRLARDLASWNRLDAGEDGMRLPGALLVADDAWGGFFAINTGALEGRVGCVHHLPAGMHTWRDLGCEFEGWLASAVARSAYRAGSLPRVGSSEVLAATSTGSRVMSVDAAFERATRSITRSGAFAVPSEGALAAERRRG